MTRQHEQVAKAHDVLLIHCEQATDVGRWLSRGRRRRPTGSVDQRHGFPMQNCGASRCVQDVPQEVPGFQSDQVQRSARS